jgi:hypothetical protein
MSELLPGMGIPAALLNVPNQLPVFASHDVVPFRFTPNLQHFIGECFTEGTPRISHDGHGPRTLGATGEARHVRGLSVLTFSVPEERRRGSVMSLCTRRDDYLAAGAKQDVDSRSAFPSKCASEHRHYHEKDRDDGVQDRA